MTEQITVALLHVKSEHSAGYGTADVDSICRRCAAGGYAALGLTDVETLAGQIELHHRAPAHGLQALTGVELRAGFGRHRAGQTAGRVVLLARDAAGYRALCHLVRRRRDRPPAAETPAPLHDLPVADAGGLFYLSDDPAVLSALLARGVDPTDLRYLLVRPGGRPGEAPAGVAAVADPDVVMLEPADQPLHALALAIRTRRRVPAVDDACPGARSLPSPAALHALYADAPAALAESARLAQACTLDLRRLAPPLPTTDLAPGQTPDAALRALCDERLAAARRSGRLLSPTYDDRLSAELAVVRSLGYAGYFLIIAELVGHARTVGVAVAGRGSALGSLVAHVLGVGPVDPVARGLWFERFLNSERRALPDVDLDLASDRRDEIIDWMFRHFGAHRVAMVGAPSRFRMRSALREGLKAWGVPATVVDRFADALPADELSASPDAPLPLGLLPPEVRPHIPALRRLEGLVQHVSVHPGGVVVVEPRVDDYAPLERASKGVAVTQYDLRSLSLLGLVKFDLLGNRALAAMELARSHLPPDAVWPPREADPAVVARLQEAATVGCFQIESPPMRSILRRLPLRGPADLVAALAIVRPGPAAGEAKAAYVRRAHGEEPAAPPIPRLDPLLRETHGLLLYDEQLMAGVAACTGWSLARADALRAAVRDADPTDPAALPRLGQAFTEAALGTGLGPGEAAAVWRAVLHFAGYAFGKAHASGYAELAWAAAALKTHHPAAFACGVLSHYGGQYPLRTVAADFARAVPLYAPDVSRSEVHARPEGAGVRLGLGALKRLTDAHRAALLAARPFRDLADLAVRVRLFAPELAALVLAGACDGLAPLSREGFPFAHRDALAALAAVGPDAAPPAVARALAGVAPRAPATDRGALFQALSRVQAELRYLEMHPSHHPLALLRSEAAREGCLSTAELAGHVGRPVRLAVLLSATRRVDTFRHEIMQYATFEDEHGLVEGVLRPSVYEALGDPLRSPGPYLVGGRVESDHGDVTLQVGDVRPFHRRADPWGRGDAGGSR